MKTFADTRRQPVDHTPARRPLVDVVADRNDGVSLALRSRGDFGETVTQQIESVSPAGQRIRRS